MKISIIGPTNIEALSLHIGKSVSDIEKIGKEVGKSLVGIADELFVVFNYVGMLKVVGDAYKNAGGELTMLYTENNYDWATEDYMKFLPAGDKLLKKPSWHDMLLDLVTKTDVVICVGISAGVLAELAYMKWNWGELKGAKKLIGIKELLNDEIFPVEVVNDTGDFAKVVSCAELLNALKLL